MKKPWRYVLRQNQGLAKPPYSPTERYHFKGAGDLRRFAHLARRLGHLRASPFFMIMALVIASLIA